MKRHGYCTASRKNIALRGEGTMIEIKRGTAADMLELWKDENAEFADKYCRNIDSGTQEIWMAWDTETATWVGELHLALQHEEAPEADTAYLLAFRVDETYQGKGIGKQLMRRVEQRASECGMTKLNVGVEETDTKVFRMYQKWGFDTKIKESVFSYEEEGETRICPFGVYQKKLTR